MLWLDKMEKNNLKKIAIIGAESTGKSWLCERLAKHFNTIWAPEYAREYFNTFNVSDYELSDLIKIAKKQLELEKDYASKANQFLFCDTSLITIKIWAELEFKKVPTFIYDQISKSDYNCFLLTNNDLPWQADNQRQNKFNRELIFKLNEDEIKKTGLPYFIVKGFDDSRLNEAIKIVQSI